MPISESPRAGLATLKETRNCYRQVAEVCRGLLVDIAMVAAFGSLTDQQLARLDAMTDKAAALLSLFEEDSTARSLSVLKGNVTDG